MIGRKRNAQIAALVLSAAFVVTVIGSILSRAEHTYRYPAYSSLNNSDFGLKAYHDALSRLGFLTERNYRPIDRIREPGSAVIQAGVDLANLQSTSAKELEALEVLAANNGRLILLLSTRGVTRISNPDEHDKPKSPTQKEVKNLTSRWGLELAFKVGELHKLTGSGGRKFSQRFAPITWYFKSWDQNWQPWAPDYRGNRILERHFGPGSIVLVPCAELFTNRELLTHSEPKLLVDVLGPYRKVVFDESRLGLQDTGTVAGLARTHNLQWLLIGFLTLAALYVWRSSLSFVPPTGAPNSPSGSTDTHRALSNLLQRCVPLAQVLQTAIAEWNGAGALVGHSKNKLSADLVGQADGAQTTSVAAAYNKIASSLCRRTRLER